MVDVIIVKYRFVGKVCLNCSLNWRFLSILVVDLKNDMRNHLVSEKR